MLTHKFLCSDWVNPRATELDDLQSSVDLIFADPPYDLGVRYADDPTGDNFGALYEEAAKMWVQRIFRCLKPGGTIWWMTPERWADTYGNLLSSLAPRMYRIIFREGFAQYQQTQLTQDYRMIFCHVRMDILRKENDDELFKRVVFNPDAIREKSVRQEIGDKRADPRGRVPGRVWDIRRLQGTSLDRVDWHPTQLAPELLRRIVLGWTNPGAVVMDAFAGSGNMSLVCLETGRSSISVDRSTTYIEKMKKRFASAIKPSGEA